MNFSYTEEQQAIFDLASHRSSRKGTPQERLLELERAEGPRFDPRALGEARARRDSIGDRRSRGLRRRGPGLSSKLAGVIEHIGRTSAPVPYLRDRRCLGGLAIAEFGSEAQKKSILPDLAAGKRIRDGCARWSAEGGDRGIRACSATGVGWWLEARRREVLRAWGGDRGPVILVSAMTDERSRRLLGRSASAGVTSRGAGDDEPYAGVADDARRA